MLGKRNRAIKTMPVGSSVRDQQRRARQSSDVREDLPNTWRCQHRQILDQVALTQGSFQPQVNCIAGQAGRQGRRRRIAHQNRENCLIREP